MARSRMYVKRLMVRRGTPPYCPAIDNRVAWGRVMGEFG